jgi:hypothetical protein
MVRRGASIASDAIAQRGAGRPERFVRRALPMVEDANDLPRRGAMGPIRAKKTAAHPWAAVSDLTPSKPIELPRGKSREDAMCSKFSEIISDNSSGGPVNVPRTGVSWRHELETTHRLRHLSSDPSGRPAHPAGVGGGREPSPAGPLGRGHSVSPIRRAVATPRRGSAWSVEIQPRRPCGHR